MKAELLKVRYLPLPRWTAAVIAATTAIVGTVLYAIASSDPSQYTSIPGSAVGDVTQFAAIVFAVWLATLEFGSGTMQLAITAEPNRSRIIRDKLAVVVLVVVVVGALVAASVSGLSELAAEHADTTIDGGELAGLMFGSVPGWVASAVIGFGFGLLTRSFGGGMGAALVFVLAFDGLISYVPGLKTLSFGQLNADLTSAIAGDGGTDHGLVVAAIGITVWSVAILLPGWIRVLRADLK